MKKYSDIILERYLLGELLSSEIEQIRKDELSDRALKKRLDALRASNTEILKEYTPEFMGARIRGSMPPSAAKKRSHHTALRILVPAGAALAAVTAVLVLFPSTVHQVETVPGVTAPQEETVRFKGGDTKLFIYRKTPEGSEQISSGFISGEGEILQLAYASSKKYGIIFSIDGRGTVTMHFPSDESSAASLQSGGTQYLKTSYQLDDAPSFEHFFFVASDRQFDPGIILSKARAAARNQQTARTCSFASDGFTEQSILVLKAAAQ